MPTPIIVALQTNSDGLKAIPEIISALVPSVDLSAMDAMMSKFKVAKPGILDVTLDTKAGPVEFILTLTP